MSKLSNIIRNPKAIAQYIKGVYDARRDKEKTYHLAFNREANGGWYIDLPEWEGAHAQLAMVAGADDLLEFVGEGAPRVEVTVVKSSETVPELVARAEERVAKAGLDGLSRRSGAEFARFRPQELAAALYRLRRLGMRPGNRG